MTMQQLDFMGHQLTAQGLKPDPSKVEAILKLESSKTKVVEAAVKSDKRLRNKTAKGGDNFYLGLLAESRILTKREEGRQGCSWSVTKSVIKQKAKT